ncbi:protein OSB2, chloroplastic-like isoform X2 [Tasmannia lanceolata]
MAQIAACHLKENDFVYVTGQLCGDPPPFTIEQGQTSIQVKVHSINFVQKSSPKEKSQVSYKHNEQAFDCSKNTTKAEEPVQSFWRDLVANPKQWWDNRMDKLNGLVSPRYPDFKHKETKLAVWLDCAPQWVLSELKGIEFEVKICNEHVSATKRTDGKLVEELWKDLVENPTKWWDNRSEKDCGSINPKSPDFKNKETDTPLWIDRSAPAWVLSKLPPVKYKQQVAIKKRETLLS